MRGALLKRLIHGILLGTLLLAACGYQVRGRETNLPPEIHSLAIPIFANRTDQTGIETDVTQALVAKFIATKQLSVTTQNSADVLLTGAVISFSTTPVAVTTSTQISTENRATVVVEFTFQTLRDAKILFREVMSEWRNYPVVSDLNTTELNKREAIRRISVLLAERVHERIIGGF
jgi:outer membrane lipopolysaccharide assembly protein LptE/RlpB